MQQARLWRGSPRDKVPYPSNRISSHPHGLGIPTVSTKAPVTAASNFGGVVTPVNVFNLQCALHSHPDRVFGNKLCLELREGAKIGYSGPKQFRFSRNLPTASLNREVVTSNLADEVATGRTEGPFPSPHLRISKFHLSALFLKSTRTSFEQYSIQIRDHKHKPFYISTRMIFPFNTSLSIKQFQLFKGSVLTVSWPKLT